MAKRSRSRRRFASILVLALLGLGGWGMHRVLSSPEAPQPDDRAASAQTPQPEPPPAMPEPQPQTSPTAGPNQQVAQPPPPVPDGDGNLVQAYRQGLDGLERGDLIEARKLLSQALASGKLPAEKAHACRTHLTAIAEKLLFSPEVYPNDPYAYRYAVRPGDNLFTIVRREGLFVPHEGIVLVNRMSNPGQLRSGQTIKLVRGPFDAVVTKHAFTLDLYHHGMFVKSYRVGLGQQGSTPVGAFVVSDRVRGATWTPPPSSAETAILQPGQPGYPLGREGLWLALRGTDENTRFVAGLGIHGTDEPQSIGREGSLGCVRLDDADIAEVFGLLYPDKSTVVIRP